MSYEEFREKIHSTLNGADEPLTWTDIRTRASLPQARPNNQWVHRMEEDIGLSRERDKAGIIYWKLG